jgi:preprotein translocase subunit SecG
MILRIAAPAAVGAGIGALLGGKKGAGIGALFGGGGGAIYHLTRNRNRRY